MASYSLDLEKNSSQYATKSTPTGMPGGQTMSAEAWCKFESLDNDHNHTIISRVNTDGSTNKSFWFYYGKEGTTPYLGIQVNGADYRHNYTGISTGTWYHLAFTYNNGTYKLYVNTTEVKSATGTVQGIPDVGTNLTVGALGTSLSYFDGLIDEVRIWNDVRTGTEISDNYRSELVGNEAGLVAYWKLNNDYLDETTSNNDLTSSGSPVFSTDVPFNVYVLAITAVSFTLTGINNIFIYGRSLACAVGTFTLTGINNIFKRGWGMIATTRNFILTGYDVLLDITGWTERTKPSTSWANRTKPSTTFTDRTKPTTTWTKVDRF